MMTKEKIMELFAEHVSEENGCNVRSYELEAFAQAILDADQADKLARNTEILKALYHCAQINNFKAWEREVRRLTVAQPVEQPVGQINQCDGCRANAPLTERGIHRYSDGSLIGCTKDRYPVAQPVESGLIRKAREVTAEHNVEAIRAYEPVAQPVEQTAPCTHANDPKACYRVRCQLGNKCVDDDMSPRIAQPVGHTRALTEDARDAARYRWLIARFTGYDFDWMPSSEDADDGKSVAVFNVGRDFRGGRDFTAALDAILAAARPASGETE